MRILLVEAARCFCGDVRLGHYLSACCFMSQFLRHASTTGTYYSTPHSSQRFVRVCMVEGGSLVILCPHSRSPSLSAQCPPGHRKHYLVSVTSTIIIIQYRFCSKKRFLFSFLFIPVVAQEGAPTASFLQPPAARTVRIEYPHYEIFTPFLAKSHYLSPANHFEREAIEEAAAC
jgi:hypothetical protein